MAFGDLVSQLDAAQLAAFGIPTIYQPQGGSPVPVRGVFDAAYVRVDHADALAGVSSSKPGVFYRLRDLPSDPDVDRPAITINGQAYRVNEVKKDGQGGVVLVLHEKA